MPRGTASITSALVLLAACAGTRPEPSTPPAQDTSGSAPDSGLETGLVDSTDTAVDTAPTDTAPPFLPTCGALPPSVCVRLTGNEQGDFAGRHVDVADMDGDGLAEIMVSESATYSLGYSGESAVRVLRSPTSSGYLADAAWLSIEGPDGKFFPSWGEPSALIPGAGQVAINDSWGHGVHEEGVRLFDLPAAGGVLGPEDQAGRLLTWGYGAYGIPSGLAGCQTSAGGPGLCVMTIDSVLTNPGDYAGQLLVYDAPIVGDIVVSDARAQYQGDPWDALRFVSGDSDLDGDGTADLVLGAFFVQNVGKVAILLDPPDGLHRVWDVADATLLGDIPGGELGIGLATGDLDADGYVDVLAGAPIGASAAAHVARGPHAGDRDVAAAEWSVVDSDGNWLGYDLGVGDFDGDGAPDLAVSAPRSFAFGTSPGEVFVFLAPAPGTYTPADATVVHTSGIGLPDAFG